MQVHSNANATLVDIANSLQQHMDEKNAKANVIISKCRMQTINEYVILFVNNFTSIVKTYNLTKGDIMVVMKILEYMRFGNLISVTNSTLANDLEMDKGNISRIMKKLKATELIVEVNGSIFFNPHIACKGTLDERKPDECYLIDYTSDVLEKYQSSATPSIATKNIRKKRRSKTTESEEELNKKVKDYIL